jgi:single-strand DNA-binding protein
MAGSANLVILIGNLTRKPELRYTPQGRAVTTLNVAVNRVYKDRDTGQQVKNTDFIAVAVWGSQAENCEKYLDKGRSVYIEGRLSLNKWEDANGESRSRLEVVARNVQFLSSAGAGTGAVSSPVSGKEEASFDENIDEVSATDEEIDEEIPF